MVEPANVMEELIACVQNTLSETALMVGVGRTVMLNCFCIPTHVFDRGVTVISAVIVVLKLLAALNAAIVPTPEAAKPMDGLEFVH